MESLPENVVIESLDALQEGRSLESILRSYPDQAEMLRPLLETAASLAAIKVAHSLEGQARSREQFLEAAASMRAAGAAGRKSPLHLWRRLAFSAAMLVMLLFLFSAGVILASQSAVPGDALYRTKRIIEDLRLSLVQDPALFESLNARFEAERIAEIEKLIGSGKTIDRLEFIGELEAVTEDSWIVGGLPLRIIETTDVTGQPKIGQQIEVVANLLEGKLIAVEIKSFHGNETVPKPEIKITPAESLEDQPSIPAARETRETDFSSPSPDTVREVTSTPAAFSTPSPAITPDPEAEVTPEPGDNANDDDDVDNNSNEDDAPGSDEESDDSDGFNSNSNDDSNENQGSDNDNGEENNDNEEENENDGSGSDEDDESDEGGGDDNENDNSNEGDSNENDRSGGD